MYNRKCLNNILNFDRKVLYMILVIVITLVLTLTIVYAALSTTLNINGTAEVSAANWDIYLDNVFLNNNSATKNVPIISNKRTVSFSTILSQPGDFYEFTIDVVNNGTIDAMIDSITQTPELSDTQKKYLSYIVEYQNGEAISTKQLVLKDSFVRLKVKIGFRTDISTSDIPETTETLNLSFIVNYVQNDEIGTNVINNGLFKLDIIEGDFNTVGSEVAIDDEHFYIISSNESSVTLLSKYNLYVGGVYNSGWTAYGDEATGIQDSTMKGWVSNQQARNGTSAFSASTYWGNVDSGVYVYDSNSILFEYIEDYRLYLEEKGAPIVEARPIKMEELESLGCSKTEATCLDALSWVYSTSYWTGAAYDSSYIWRVHTNGYLFNGGYNSNLRVGTRPVIVINIS